MGFKKVLIVSKKTELEFNEEKYGNAVDAYYRRNNIDWLELEKEHKYHYECLDMIVDCFKQSGIKPGLIKKQGLARYDFENDWDLIVPVGGDGTFMDVARYIHDDTMVFGIKSSPFSVGGHYNANFGNAEESIRNILLGNFLVDDRTRLEGMVDNDIKDLALNEIYVGDLYGMGYSRLVVNREEVGCSGLVISTYRGSTGWFNNIAVLDEEGNLCNGCNFIEEEDKIARYKIREYARGDAPRFGILEKDDVLVIESRSLIDGKVSFDGSKPNQLRHRVYDLPYSRKVEIRISDEPLKVIVPKYS